jgi:hypothetical protein
VANGPRHLEQQQFTTSDVNTPAGLQLESCLGSYRRICEPRACALGSTVGMHVRPLAENRLPPMHSGERSQFRSSDPELAWIYRQDPCINAGLAQVWFGGRALNSDLQSGQSGRAAFARQRAAVCRESRSGAHETGPPCRD